MRSYKTINEYVKRFNNINKYILEQEAMPDVEGMTPDGEEGAVEQPAEAPMPTTDEVPMEAGVEQGMEQPTEMGTENVEEVDITDLVNMTKSIKNDIDDFRKEQSTQDKDIVLTKLEDLTNSISKIDDIFDKINALEDKVEKMKEPTAIEKLELRSLNSFPFNQRIDNFFVSKENQTINDKTLNNYEFVPQELEGDDVEDNEDYVGKYNGNIAQSFNPFKNI